MKDYSTFERVVYGLPFALALGMHAAALAQAADGNYLTHVDGLFMVFSAATAGILACTAKPVLIGTRGGSNRSDVVKGLAGAMCGLLSYMLASKDPSNQHFSLFLALTIAAGTLAVACMRGDSKNESLDLRRSHP